MPPFGDQSGGPLREDQIRTIAAFIENWEQTATLVAVPTPPTGPTVGTDITKELPEGDAASGEALAVSLGCTACHLAGASGAGPDWLASPEQPGVGERAALRLEQSDYTGNATTAEEYLFESIVLPADASVSSTQITNVKMVRMAAKMNAFGIHLCINATNGLARPRMT